VRVWWRVQDAETRGERTHADRGRSARREVWDDLQER
jgi:hypothetical protein